MLMLGRALHTVAGKQLIAAGLPQRAAHGPGVQQPRRVRRRARARLEQGERRVSAGRPGSGCGVRAGGQQRHDVPVRGRAGRRARGVRAAVCSALGTARRRHLMLCRQSLPRRNAVCMPVQRSAAESGMCPALLSNSTAACAAVQGCGLMRHAPASRVELVAGRRHIGTGAACARQGRARLLQRQHYGLVGRLAARPGAGERALRAVEAHAQRRAAGRLAGARAARLARAASALGAGQRSRARSQHLCAGCCAGARALSVPWPQAPLAQMRDPAREAVDKSSLGSSETAQDPALRARAACALLQVGPAAKRAAQPPPGRTAASCMGSCSGMPAWPM